MNKRKPLNDRNHGTEKRPSLESLRVRTAQIAQRKSGATNVQPSVSHKAVEAQMNAKRSDTNLIAAQKNAPRSRFQPGNKSVSSPRLKQFPVERIRKLDNSPSYLPRSMMNRNEDDYTDRSSKSVDRVATYRANHGHGDAVKIPEMEMIMHQHRESPQPVATSQQNVPMTQHANKLNQSEAVLASAMPSSGRQVHRPYVPNAPHGTNIGDSSPQKSAMSPVRPAATIVPSGSHQQQDHQRDTTTINQRANLSRSPIRQEQPQIQHQTPRISAQKRPSIEPNTGRNRPPWRNDPPTEPPDYENRPMGGFAGPTSSIRPHVTFHDEKLIRDPKMAQPLLPNRSMGMDYMPSTRSNAQQYRYLNGQPPNHVHPQQMYQQMRENVLEQKQMQQKIPAARFQNMTTQPRNQHQLQTQFQHLPRHLNPPPQQMRANQANVNYPVVQPPPGHHYPPMYSGMTSPQDVQANQTRISHQQMHPQQRRIGYATQQASPQNAWIQNTRVNQDHSGFKSELQRLPVDFVPPGATGTTTFNGNQYQQMKQSDLETDVQQRDMSQWNTRRPYTYYNGSNAQSVNRGAQPQIQQAVYSGIADGQIQNSSFQQYASTQSAGPAAIYGHQLRQKTPMKAHVQHQNATQQPTMNPTGIQRLTESEKRKNPEFTVDMLRDQEMLLMKLRQQKIPEDIIKRHFDLLLDEQRRYLWFLAQHQLIEKKKEPRTVRKISKNPTEDQRPEWMGRITPPRMTIQQLQNSQQNQDQPQLRQYSGPQKITGREKQGIVGQEFHPENHHDPYHAQHPSSLNHNHNYQTAMHSHNRTWYPQYAHGQAPPNWQQNYNHQPNQIANYAQQQNSASQFQHFIGQQRPQYQLQNQQVQGGQEPVQYDHQPQSLYPQSKELPQLTPKEFQQWQQVVQQQQIKQQQKTMEHEAEEWKRYNWSMQHQQGLYVPQDKPSSLLKLREYKKFIRPQQQNNGLQDAETIQRALEALKAPESKKGLEYLSNLEKKEHQLKLNGTQEPSELEKLPGPPVEYLQRLQEQQKRAESANGLCNSRNPNNPMPPPFSFSKKTESHFLPEYPPRNGKRAMSIDQGSLNVIPEKEHDVLVNAYSQQQGHFLNGYGSYSSPSMSISAQPNLLHSSYDSSQEMPGYPDNMYGPNQQIYGNKNTMPQRGVQQQYKIDEAQSRFGQSTQQFQSHQRWFKNSGEGDNVPLQGGGSQIRADLNPELQSTGDIMRPVDGMRWEKMPAQPQYNQTVSSYGQLDSAQLANNQYPQIQQGGNYGHPEIRQAKTIGGITYLARKADYVPNPPVVAPGTLLASKFLQPPASFI